MTFNFNEKEVTVSVEAEKLFEKKMKMPLDRREAASALEVAYSGDPVLGEYCPSLEEVVNDHSEEELSEALSNMIIKEMEDYV